MIDAAKRKPRTLVSTGAVIQIPTDVAVCPICDGKLSTQADEWTERTDGTWKAVTAHPECEHEPEIDSDEWDDWHRGHYSMPYLDWLPLERPLLRWLNRNYDWDVRPSS